MDREAGGPAGDETPGVVGEPVLREDAAGPPAGEDMGEEGEQHREVRVDENVMEPLYDQVFAAVAEESSGTAHGSHGSQGGAIAMEQSAPPSDRQRPMPMTLIDDGMGQGLEQSARDGAQEAMDRRSEDVSQVARSLAYMTSLVTTLVGRMERVEQAQTSSSGRRTAATTSAQMETPMGGTPEGGSLGWVDLRRLDAQLSQMSIGGGDADRAGERPLATLDSIMAGTFSSDDSETAKRRLEQGRGIPGSLLGPLAAPLNPIVLSGIPGGEEVDEAAQRALQDRVAEALAAERVRLAQEALKNPAQPPGLILESTVPAVQSLSAPPGFTLSAMQSLSAPQGSGQAAVQSLSAPQGSGQSAMQSLSAPQGSGQSAMQSLSAPQGSGQSAMQSLSAPQGSSQSAMQSLSAPQGSSQSEMQSLSAPQGSGPSAMQSLGAPQGSSMLPEQLLGMPQGSLGLPSSGGAGQASLPICDGPHEVSQPGTSYASVVSGTVQEQCKQEVPQTAKMGGWACDRGTSYGFGVR